MDPHLRINDFAETKVIIPSLHCLVIVSNEDTHHEATSTTIPNHDNNFPLLPLNHCSPFISQEKPNLHVVK